MPRFYTGSGGHNSWPKMNTDADLPRASGDDFPVLIEMIQAGFFSYRNEDCLVLFTTRKIPFLLAKKDAARFLVYNEKESKHKPGRQKYPDPEALACTDKELDEDLEAAVRALPDAIRLPKVECAEEVKRVDKKPAIENKAKPVAE